MRDKAVESRSDLAYPWVMKNDVTKMRMQATREARAMIFGAAKRSGMSVSKFVVQASVERANRTLHAHENRPALEDMNAKFFAALDEIDRQKVTEKAARQD
jgi:uncharacterized protein (DUF1778 family)